jgi:hypothetical protein
MVALLYKLHGEKQTCRQITLDAAGRAHPLRMVVFVEQFAASDKLWADIATGKSTWAEFNQGLKEIGVAAQGKMAQADVQIVTGLANQHMGEIAQRQRAAAAFQQWAYQQQVLYQQQQAINAINSPRTINCNYFGNTARCNSF